LAVYIIVTVIHGHTNIRPRIFWFSSQGQEKFYCFQHPDRLCYPPAFYSVDTLGSFPNCQAAGTWNVRV